MKLRILTTTATAAVLAFCLSACATFDPSKYTEAFGSYDEGCYKRTSVKVVPMLIGVWPVPIATIDHEKICNPEVAQRPAPVAAGQVRTFE
jgi:hypothetical protein